jgi:hypothetical protein
MCKRLWGNDMQSYFSSKKREKLIADERGWTQIFGGEADIQWVVNCETISQFGRAVGDDTFSVGISLPHPSG